jgi:hypothetical protein
MPDGAILVGVGLWLHFVGSHWARLADRAKSAASPNFRSRELVQRHRNMGKVAPWIKRLARALLIVGILEILAYVAGIR